MQEQLIFGGDGSGEWRLDERTRNIGRQGIAAARERLERCQGDFGLTQAA